MPNPKAKYRKWTKEDYIYVIRKLKEGEAKRKIAEHFEIQNAFQIRETKRIMTLIEEGDEIRASESLAKKTQAFRDAIEEEYNFTATWATGDAEEALKILTQKISYLEKKVEDLESMLEIVTDFSNKIVTEFSNKNLK